jgi:hypothetical protein
MASEPLLPKPTVFPGVSIIPNKYWLLPSFHFDTIIFCDGRVGVDVDLPGIFVILPDKGDGGKDAGQAAVKHLDTRIHQVRVFAKSRTKVCRRGSRYILVINDKEWILHGPNDCDLLVSSSDPRLKETYVALELDSLSVF